MRLGAKFGEFKYANRMPAFESMLMSLLVAFSIAGLLYIIVRLTRRRAAMEPERKSEKPGPRIFSSTGVFTKRKSSRPSSRRTGTPPGSPRGGQFLSRLENRELVEADRTRTNREYLAQLRAQTLPTSVEKLLIGMVEAYDRFYLRTSPHRRTRLESFPPANRRSRAAASSR